MEQMKLHRRLKALLALSVLIVVVWLTWLIIESLTFHLVNTTPSEDSVSTVSTYIKLNFNRTLSSHGFSISEEPSIGSWQVSGKTITINIASILNQNSVYVIHINSLEDTKGEKISNLKVSFKPQYTAFTSLPSDQQKAILNHQSKAAVSQVPTFSGTDALLNSGLSSTQIETFEQAVINFTSTKHITAGAVVISSLYSTPISGNGVFGLKFQLTINPVQYNATIQYTGLEAMQLTIDNLQGAQLYQYGSVNGSNTAGSSSSP